MIGEYGPCLYNLLLNNQTLDFVRGSVVKCLTPNPGVLGSSCTGSSRFFVGMSLGRTLQSPSLVLVKPRNVSCYRDTIEYC